MKKAAPSGRKGDGGGTAPRAQEKPRQVLTHLTGQATKRKPKKATAALYHILLLADKSRIDKE